MPMPTRIDTLAQQTTWTAADVAEFEHLLAEQLHFPLLDLFTQMLKKV